MYNPWCMSMVNNNLWWLFNSAIPYMVFLGGYATNNGMQARKCFFTLDLSTSGFPLHPML